MVSLFESIIHSINKLLDYYNTEFPAVSLRYTYNRLGLFTSEPFSECLLFR